MAVVASRIRRRLQAHANAHASPRHNRAVQGRFDEQSNRPCSKGGSDAVLASRIGALDAGGGADGHPLSPPGCGAGPLGRMRALSSPSSSSSTTAACAVSSSAATAQAPLDCRRMRACASCRALSPCRHPIARLVLSVPLNPNAPGFISVANFEEVAEVQGETVRAYTHTHTHTHAVGALRINVRYRARRFMRTCVHARINAGITQLSLLARLLLFENPCSPESLLLARRCMWVYVFACV